MLPDELEYLWGHYVFLSNRRRYNQSTALPITLHELRVYDEDYFVGLTIWDKKTLCRMDDTVCPAINGRIARVMKSGGKAEPVQIDIHDGASIAQSFKARAEAMNAQRKAKKAKEGKV